VPGLASIVLPNGWRIAHLNRAETDYLYQEIFVDRIYTPPGFPVLGPAPTIFDVGANIGLFSLFALDQWPDARVFAFEPVPQIFEVLRANLAEHPNADAVAAALGATNGTATISYYPRYTMMSGVHADASHDRAIAKRYLLNLAEGIPDVDERAAVIDTADELLATRFESVTVDCALERVATVVSRLGIEGIDLLKVDTERAELDVMLGVGEQLWPRVRNVVVEVEDDAGQAAAIRDLLTGYGMRVRVSQSDEYRGTALHMLYASR
jgi:31-O-methyltransferase